MLLIRDDEVRTAASGPDVLDRMEQMLARRSGSGLELPPRLTVDATRGKGWMRLMPVIAYDTGYAGFKAMNYHPDEGVRYFVAMISLADGSFAALIDADWITAYRTAATSAIAARHLACDGAETIGVFGSGTQAKALLQATSQVIEPRQVTVYSPTQANREKFAATMSEELGLTVHAVDEPGKVLGSSQVVLSAFRAGTTPVIHAESVPEGSLICGISSVRPEHREVDTSVWKSSRIVADDLSHVLESGDGRAALAAGLVNDDAIPELWQVLQDPTLGRRRQDERLLFKSVGTAEQDIALAAIVLENARSLGLGEQIDGFPAVRPIQSKQVMVAQGA